MSHGRAAIADQYSLADTIDLLHCLEYLKDPDGFTSPTSNETKYLLRIIKRQLIRQLPDDMLRYM